MIDPLGIRYPLRSGLATYIPITDRHGPRNLLVAATIDIVFLCDLVRIKTYFCAPSRKGFSGLSNFREFHTIWRPASVNFVMYPPHIYALLNTGRTS